MPGRLIDATGETEVALQRAELAGLAAREDARWLDLFRPTGEELDLVSDAFGFHPLSRRDAKRFEQRPKLEEYDDYAFLVVFGGTHDEDDLVEVHVFCSEHYLVTVHRDEAPAFDEARQRLAQRGHGPGQPAVLLYHLVDGLTDSFFPILDELDDRIDSLADAILERATDEQLQDVFHLKRTLVGLRKVIAPQRDVFASLNAGATTLPGTSAEAERYFRDLYDHLIRLTDQIDSYRDLLTSTMDVYLSTVSNRLNAVMKQLAVIATVFLPLTFITGFFGQNFAWLVDHVGGLGWFLGLGIATQVAALAALLLFFRRRGWF